MSRDKRPSVDPQIQLITRAWQNDDFRRDLLSNPKAAIERELNVSLPAGLTVQVHEQSDNVLHLVLPPKPRGGELSDEQLETVAGGFNPQPEPPGMPSSSNSSLSNYLNSWVGNHLNTLIR